MHLIQLVLTFLSTLSANTYLCLPTVIDYNDADNGGFGANKAPILSSTLPDSQLLA